MTWRREVNATELRALEARLDTYELVSLVFLLYERNEEALELTEALAAGQKLEILSPWKTSEGDLEKLVEALLVIKTHSEVLALDVDLDEANAFFLPNTPDAAVRLNPAKKALYYVCEDYERAETDALVRDVRCECDELLPPPNILEREHLEIFILRLAVAGAIKFGSLSSERCELSLLSKNLDSRHSELCKKLESLYGRFGTNSDRSETTPDEYIITDSKHVGRFIIFNEERFAENTFPDRIGSYKDVERLKDCFKTYGFSVSIFNNLKAVEIMNMFRKNMSEAAESDSVFAACILTHGMRDCVFDVEGHRIPLDDIKDVLCESRKFASKPKILIVQACRGSEIMGVIKPPTEPHSPREVVQTDGSPYAIGVDAVPSRADLLIFYATVENYVSFRNVEQGTWFIQELCKSMMERGDSINLLDVITVVTNEVSKKKYQVCQVESTFRKVLRLRKI